MRESDKSSAMSKNRQKYVNPPNAESVLDKGSLFLALMLLIFITQMTTEARTVEARELNTQQGEKSADEAPVRDKWAVVVGVSKFANSTMNLHYPEKDAKDFYNYLVNEAGFAADHVFLLLDEQATRQGILSAIGGKGLPHAVLPGDLVLIYISTHGSCPDAKVDGVNYLVAHDTDPEDIYSTGIAMQDLTRIIKGKVNTDRIVILLDACHSGSVASDSKGLGRSRNIEATSVLQGCGQIVICSSEPGQVSWESKSYPNGVFTRQLLDGLRSKGNQTTIEEAYKQMKKQTEQEVTKDRGVLQTPVMRSKWQGKPLLVAIPPAEPRPGLEVSAAKTETKSSAHLTVVKAARLNPLSLERLLQKTKIDSRELDNLAGKVVTGLGVDMVVQTTAIYGDAGVFYKDAIDFETEVERAACSDTGEPPPPPIQPPLPMSAGYFMRERIYEVRPDLMAAERRLEGIALEEATLYKRYKTEAELQVAATKIRAEKLPVSEALLKLLDPFNAIVSAIARRKDLSFVAALEGVIWGGDAMKSKGTDITDELIAELKK